MLFLVAPIDSLSITNCTECWSQGRAKLCAFPRHLARENTQLSPSLTPTLSIEKLCRECVEPRYHAVPRHHHVMSGRSVPN